MPKKFITLAIHPYPISKHPDFAYEPLAPLMLLQSIRRLLVPARLRRGRQGRREGQLARP